MGNPGRDKVNKEKNLPPTVQISAPSSKKGAAGNNIEADVVELENIDVAVARTVTEKDKVVIRLENGIYKVFRRNLRLGDIPVKYNQSLLLKKVYSGEVHTVNIGEASITVLVTVNF